MTLSKEQAEAASNELLAKAHAGDAQRKRVDINWYWLIPFFAAGVVAIISGTFGGSYLLLAAGLALIAFGVWLAIKPQDDEPVELGSRLVARPPAAPALLLRVVVTIATLACLVLYLRPAAPVTSPKPVDAPDCRLLGDWTASSSQLLSLYTFKADGTYEVHGEFYAPPNRTGDWLLENNRLRLWKDPGMRQARGPYEEAPVTWADDRHFKMNGADFVLLRKERAANCKG